MWGRNVDDTYYHFFKSMADAEYACGKRQYTKNTFTKTEPPDQCQECLRVLSARQKSKLTTSAKPMPPQFNPVFPQKEQRKWQDVHGKHPGAICIANYKGGVGKTTLTYLLGSFLAEYKKKKVLLFDLDPQCSLSLVAGCTPAEVGETSQTVYDLVHPDRWANISGTHFNDFITETRPEGLHIVRGSFEVDNLDTLLVESGVRSGNDTFQQLCRHCKEVLKVFQDFDYILVDCPPNYNDPRNSDSGLRWWVCQNRTQENPSCPPFANATLPSSKPNWLWK